MDNAAKYLFTCKSNYFSVIRPADNNSKNEQGYKTLVQIAMTYFDNNRYNDFAGFFMEGQYFVDLWTAHLILEFGNPDQNLIDTCIEIIKGYSKGSLDEQVTAQEKKWLDDFLKEKERT